MDILDRLPSIVQGARRLWEDHTVPSDLTYEAVMDRYEGCTGQADSGAIITGDSLNIAKTLYAGVRAGLHDAPQLIYMDPPFYSNADYTTKINIQGVDGEDISVSVPAFSDRWDEMGVRKGAVITGDSPLAADPPQSSDTSSVSDVPQGAYFSDNAVCGEKSGFAQYLMMLALRITAAKDLLVESGSLWIHLDHHAAHYVKLIADSIFGGNEYLINEIIWHYKSGGASGRRFARKHDTLLLYAKNPKKHKFYPLTEKSYNRGRKPYRFKGVKEYSDEGGWYTLVNMRDVWQIDMVGRTSKERTGYATQKPEALLERAVLSCTAPGELCIDMFGGSGTMAAVCAKSERRWISIDVSRYASLYAEKRIAKIGAPFAVMGGSSTVADVSDGADGVGTVADIPDDSARRTVQHCARDLPVGMDISRKFSVACERCAGGSPCIKIRLASYTVPDEILCAAGEKKAALMIAAKKHPAQFAASIAVDTEYDGDLFRPKFAAYGQGEVTISEKGEIAIQPLEQESAPRIAVRVVDLFGNSLFKFFAY